jgi:dTDP-4-amino-4,6-dideoxygalactose transaminase
MSAALGRVQMNRIDELLEKRAKVAAWYNQIFAEIDEIETPQVAGTTTRTSWFVYVIRLSPAINRNTVAEKLKKEGIPARPYFVPIHLQPYMVQRFGYKTGDFPVTEDLGERGLALPFSSVMKKSQVDQVCSVVKKILVDPENH